MEDIVTSGLSRYGRGLALDVVCGKMYWTDPGEGLSPATVGRIQRANFDGSNIEELLASGRGIYVYPKLCI